MHEETYCDIKFNVPKYTIKDRLLDIAGEIKTIPSKLYNKVLWCLAWVLVRGGFK